MGFSKRQGVVVEKKKKKNKNHSTVLGCTIRNSYSSKNIGQSLCLLSVALRNNKNNSKLMLPLHPLLHLHINVIS